MDGLKNLVDGPHGILAVVLIVCASVLAALRIIDPTAWQNFVMIIFGTFTVGHVGVAIANARRPLAADKETK